METRVSSVAAPKASIPTLPATGTPADAVTGSYSLDDAKYYNDPLLLDTGTKSTSAGTSGIGKWKLGNDRRFRVHNVYGGANLDSAAAKASEGEHQKLPTVWAVPTDPKSGAGEPSCGGKWFLKKNLLGIAALLLLLLVAIAAVTFGILFFFDSESGYSSVSYEGSNFTHFCKAATYPALCQSTLNEDPRAIKATPQEELLSLTVDAATWQMWTVSEVVNSLSSQVNSSNETLPIAPNEQRWLQMVLLDCQDMLQMAMDNLQDTAEAIEKRNFIDTPSWLAASSTLNLGCTNDLVEFVPSSTNTTWIEALQWQSRHAGRQLANSLSLINNYCKGGGCTPLLPSKASQPAGPSPPGRKLLQLNEHSENVGPVQTGFYPWPKLPARKKLSTTTLTVAKDGSGNFKTIQAAIDAVPKNSDRVVINIKPGTYNEQIQITKKLITLAGESAGNTIITNSHSVGGGYTTFSSCTFCVNAKNFIAFDIKFINSAPQGSGQAVAIRVNSDQAMFYRCIFQGNQDTLYLSTGRVYLSACYVFGTVDFIFGNAAAYFQNCIIFPLTRTDKKNWVDTITAQGRVSSDEPTGFVFNNTQVRDAQGASLGRIYLGRPWKTYARVIFINTFLPSSIDRAKWLTWNGDTRDGKPFLAEYGSYGPGAARNLESWVKPGVLQSSQVKQFTPSAFIDSPSWILIS